MAEIYKSIKDSVRESVLADDLNREYICLCEFCTESKVLMEIQDTAPEVMASEEMGPLFQSDWNALTEKIMRKSS
jgi:hypothetical protein